MGYSNKAGQYLGDIMRVWFALSLACLLFGAPAQAKTPLVFEITCDAAREVVDEMAKGLPADVDAVTKTTAVRADCDGKRVDIARSVELKQSRMEKDFRDYLQKQDDDFACGTKALRRLIDGGWRVAVTYVFTDGDPVVTTPACDNA